MKLKLKIDGVVMLVEIELVHDDDPQEPPLGLVKKSEYELGLDELMREYYTNLHPLSKRKNPE